MAVDAPLSIAVHLLVKGQVEEAAVISEREGVSLAALGAAVQMLKSTSEDQRRHQRDVARVVTGVGDPRIEVIETRSGARVKDWSPKEIVTRSWRAGWAAAVLCKPVDDNPPAREGAAAFASRFAAYTTQVPHG